MASRHAVCESLGVLLLLIAFATQVNLTKSAQNTQDTNTTINNLVTTYNSNKNWTSLRNSLELLLDRSSATYRQLLRIPSDEQWPLKKASAVPGYLDLLTLLLDAGLDVDAAVGSHASTMLHWAALSGVRDVVDLLLGRGAGLERRTSGGATALLLAARNGHSELAASLLERGADAKAATFDGWTSLHCAATRDDVGLARQLVAAGAPTNGLARTRWGSSTPLDIARIYGQPRVEEYLAVLDAGATTPNS